MRQIAYLAGLLVIGGGAFGADPKLMNLVMPDAKVVGGVNVTSAKISPLGQFIISQLQGSDPRLRSLIAATGFDPFTDVTELLAASAVDPAKPGGLLLMDGTFKVDQIVAALQNQKNQQVRTYAGATLITFTDPTGKVNAGVAFIGNTIAVAGDAATVEAALDRSSGVNSIDPALATRVNALSRNDDAWMVSSAPVASLLPAGSATAGGPAVQVLQMLNGVQSFSGAVKLGDNVQTAVQAEASSAKNAEALGDVVRLVASLGAMNVAKDPQTAGLMQLLQTLQVSTSGTEVDLALTIPESQVEGLLKSIPAPAKALKAN